MTTERGLLAAEIERLRDALARTVDVLAARADVKTRLLGSRARHTTRERADRPDEEKTAGELIRQATEQLTLLARSEVRLAQLEVGETAIESRGAIACLGAAGAIALLGVGALATMLALVLATAVGHAWIAVLLVALLLLAIALALAVVGRRRVVAAHAAHRARARPERGHVAR